MNISKRDLVRLHAALNGEFQDDGLVKIEIFSGTPTLFFLRFWGCMFNVNELELRFIDILEDFFGVPFKIVYHDALQYGWTTTIGAGTWSLMD